MLLKDSYKRSIATKGKNLIKNGLVLPNTTATSNKTKKSVSGVQKLRCRIKNETTTIKMVARMTNVKRFLRYSLCK